MNTKTKAILASTLLTALFAGQSAIAGQDNDQGVFASDTAITLSVMTDKHKIRSQPYQNFKPGILFALEPVSLD